MNELSIQLGANRELFGILHQPPASEATDLAFLFLNAGLIHRPGPFRLHTELSRKLGLLGISSLRIDHCGKGDSPRRPGTQVTDSEKTDLDLAVNYLKSTGAKRVVLVGLCSGADAALWYAKESEEISGLVLLDGYAPMNSRFQHVEFLRKVRRATPGKLVTKILEGIRPNQSGDDESEIEMGNLRNFPSSEEAISIFKGLITRHQHCLCVYTGDVAHYYNHQGQLRNSIDHSECSTFITEVFFPEAKHTYPFVADRKNLIATVTRWADATFLQDVEANETSLEAT